MSYRHNFLRETENRIVHPDNSGKYNVIEYIRDLSVDPTTAQMVYYANEMNIRKRQLQVNLHGDDVIIQAGAMQWVLGSVEARTNIKGAGDFLGKMVSSKVTGETAVKPRYSGEGVVVLEPTYKHLITQDLEKWNGAMVIEDGLFLACDGTVKIKTVMRSNLSSAALGGEGLFNSCLTGEGRVVLESPVPAEELIVVDLLNDVLKIDGSMAIAWSNSLQFTVERTTKSLIGSAASGEGLVNVYRGTGRVLLAPVL